MSVLVFESDPTQAERIQHIVRDVVGAKLTLVRSIDQAMAALQGATPDLILAPALISPEEEARLLASVRALPNGAHVETLITPLLPPPDADVNQPQRIWRPWGASRVPTTIDTTTQILAEQLVWVLDRAYERRQLLEPLCEEPQNRVVEPTTSSRGDWAERRAHQRFQAGDLHALRMARIKAGPFVSLLDVSVGGALLKTSTSLMPESEAVLEVVTDHRHEYVPFRVLRCQVVPGSRYPRYVAACSFTAPLDIDKLVQVSESANARNCLSKEPTPLPSILEQVRQIRNEDNISASPLTQTETVPPDDPAEKRQYPRVKGPFDGCRRGLIDLPVRILDISEGGCFVGALVDANPGDRLTLGVRCPGEDWITVAAEVVHNQIGTGFAVRFVEISEDARSSLARLVAERI